MIKSMTGYGKSECDLSIGKVIVELRSVNGKNADISIKSSLVPRDKEIEIRKYITEKLSRGSIDLFANLAPGQTTGLKNINKEVFLHYYGQISGILEAAGICGQDNLAATILKMPDVVDTAKSEFTEDDWTAMDKAIKEAVDKLNEFRSREGAILYRDVTSKVESILSYLAEVERIDPQRVPMIRERIQSKIEEVCKGSNPERLEQEMIFYIEKLDINEEKVRLRQHCKYFMDTIDNEPLPGKKLGFIAQEMGREINTMGSKANNAEIQQLVVRMKDELEKIKEQSLNIL